MNLAIDDRFPTPATIANVVAVPSMAPLDPIPEIALLGSVRKPLVDGVVGALVPQARGGYTPEGNADFPVPLVSPMNVKGVVSVTDVRGRCEHY